MGIKELKIKDSDKREAHADVSDLVDSMKFIQISPVIIDDDGFILAGRRRYLAAIQLGWTQTCEERQPSKLWVKRFSQLSELEKMRVKIDENVKRVDYSWAEQAAEVSRFHELCRQQNSQWSQDDTAREIGMTQARVSQILAVAPFVSDPVVKGADTFSDAYKQVLIKKELEAKRELERRALATVDTMAAREIYVNADCLKFMAKLPDCSFDLVLTDPPFFIDIADRSGKGMVDNYINDLYQEDSPSKISEVIPVFLDHSYRLLKDGSYCIFWFGIDNYPQVEDCIKRSRFKYSQVPIIWVKPEKFTPIRHTTVPKSVYEAAFLCWKGSARLREMSARNVYVVESVPSSQRIHPLEKPQDLLRAMLNDYSIIGDRVLDPFAGSGSTVLAALSCHRKPLGIEKDPDYYERGLGRLVHAR